MKNRWLRVSCLPLVTVFLTHAPVTSSATELTGTPEELRNFLQSETRTVVLRNEAIETAYTDIAKITLVVLTEAKALSVAIEENLGIREQVRRDLIASGVPEDKINTSKYSASPQFGWFGKSPASYEVVNTVVVEVDSESLFQTVANLADANEAITLGGVAFEHKAEKEFENMARDKAVQAVLADAAYFEARLGLELRPVQFDFSHVHRNEFRKPGMLEEIVVTAQRMKQSGDARPTTFDEIEYRAVVQITFEVKQQQ